MLGTAIIGAGLSGLTLARSLQQEGAEFALFEARDRLGGRILSVPGADGMMLDLGPAWYWPDTQPRITQLVATLGLAAYSQHDQGTVLNLTDPDKAPHPYPTQGLHGGAQRLVGGMASLVQALAADLPAAALHLEHVLFAVIAHDDHVELHFHCGDRVQMITAQRVVLTLPPRLVEEHIRFEPPLDDALHRSMQATYTWMADQAKVVVTYAQPFWRSAGLAGNAFVNHEQAVLYEIFDACNATGDQAALGGFMALSPALRTSFQVGLPLLISSQLVQLFGGDADQGTQHIQDWAGEIYTSSTLDQSPPAMHPAYDDPALRQPLWKSRLYFGGSETANYAAGYMEGALEASGRVALMLTGKNGIAHSVSYQERQLIASTK